MEEHESHGGMNALDDVGDSQVSHNFNICILRVLLIMFLYEKVTEKKRIITRIIISGIRE